MVDLRNRELLITGPGFTKTLILKSVDFLSLPQFFYFIVSFESAREGQEDGSPTLRSTLLVLGLTASIYHRVESLLCCPIRSEAVLSVMT